jgi:aspartate-semialdehyde dehydrogenase
LIVPEINASSLTKEDKIIANPNCSTIQMVLVLAPLHKKIQHQTCCGFYQSITGTGVKAVEQLENEYAGVQGEMAYKYLFIEMQFHNVMYLKKTDTKERNEIGS